MLRQFRRRLLLVHAHPDDETLTTGGTIARYAAEPDVSVTVVTCTLGEEGDVMVPALKQLAATSKDQLGGYRLAELLQATAALGPIDHRVLGGAGRWRDSGVIAFGEAHGTPLSPAHLGPGTFCYEGARAEQVNALAAIMEDIRPQVVITYDPAGGYGHPDHVRAHEITMLAVERCESVREVYWTVTPRSELETGLEELAEVAHPFRLGSTSKLASVPDEWITARLDIEPWLAAKEAALRAHATQLRVWRSRGCVHPAFALSDEVAQPVFLTECYASPSGPSDVVKKDLFADVDLDDSPR